MQYQISKTIFPPNYVIKKSISDEIEKVTKFKGIYLSSNPLI